MILDVGISLILFTSILNIFFKNDMFCCVVCLFGLILVELIQQLSPNVVHGFQFIFLSKVSLWSPWLLPKQINCTSTKALKIKHIPCQPFCCYPSYSKSTIQTFSSSLISKMRAGWFFQLSIMFLLDLLTAWGREVPHPCINTSLCDYIRHFWCTILGGCFF